MIKKHYIKKLDITSEESVHEVVSYIEQNSLSIDILVNSAGKAVFTNFLENKKRFMDLCETNIYGTFNCIQKFSKLADKQGIRRFNYKYWINLRCR